MVKPQSIDWIGIRKLIYVRFTDEIVSKPNNSTDEKSQDTKECVNAVNNITDEFKTLREQGYDFKKLRDSISNHNSSEDLEECSNSDNSISKSLSDRMRELVISWYMSSYSGESFFREEIEKVINKKSEVIREFMQRAMERAEVVISDHPALLVDLENGGSVTALFGRVSVGLFWT